MIPPAESLLKYDNAVLVSKSTDRKSPKGRPLRVSPQQPADSSPVPQPPKPKSASADATKQENDEILNASFHPDVIRLEELLDIKMQQRQARQTGICPVRRELFSQCFDELIRQVTINCAERGLLLLRVRDEIQMTMAAYQTLYESSVAFGMRKALQAEQGKDDMERRISELGDEKQELKKQLNEEKAKSDSIEKRENEKRQVEEKKHSEEIQFLKRTNQQLKVKPEDSAFSTRSFMSPTIRLGLFL
ncbi:hypothetical protein F7725_018108 [Dissostichus mawsoni]|uniref:Axonemal dynein light intermediate polypeptide 1 n=1 Tax=Dissostichus mawsoni TaxID=36200 RepID=A0A7J5XR44_DISMA|nr:hypothetical protein F7725_018108 [Dissostichus mawsoni]